MNEPLATRKHYAGVNLSTMMSDPDVHVRLLIEEANVRTMVDNILTALHQAYPAYVGKWHIVVNAAPTGGIIQVRNTAISMRYGFQAPITMVDPEMKNIKMMAGELFERYRLRRGVGHRKADQDLSDLAARRNRATGEAEPDQ